MKEYEYALRNFIILYRMFRMTLVHLPLQIDGFSKWTEIFKIPYICYYGIIYKKEV